MKNYTQKQIAIWEKSLVTIWEGGYMQNTGELGESTLLSLFIEGFSRTDDVRGNMCILTAAGIQLEIHSASLAKALRKRLKEHQKNRLNRELRNEMKTVLKSCGKYDRAASFDIAEVIGCNADDKTTRVEYILFGNGGKKYVFERITWNAALELVKITK